MTHRRHMTPEQRRAHSILDLVKSGYQVPNSRVRWALIVLGDMA